jgi:hypothetical protein
MNDSWSEIYTEKQKTDMIKATLPLLEQLVNMPQRKEMIKKMVLTSEPTEKFLFLNKEGLWSGRTGLFTRYKCIKPKEYSKIIETYALTPELLNDAIKALVNDTKISYQ